MERVLQVYTRYQENILEIREIFEHTNLKVFLINVINISAPLM